MTAKTVDTTPRPVSGRTLAGFTGRAYELLRRIETARGERSQIELHVYALERLCGSFRRDEVRS